MTITGLEEHYCVPEVVTAWETLDDRRRDPTTAGSAGGDIGRRLQSLEEERLAVMDDAGVDVQVLSLTTPGLFDLAPAEAGPLQTVCNDRIAEAVSRHPDRLQGFATLAPQRPEEAAAELERAVTKLGMYGALVFSRVRDEPIDHAEYWPIFEAAEALRVPLYLHPQTAPAPVRQAYYTGFGDAVDLAFATHGVGWHYDTGVQFLRLVFAGVFDRFPNLQVVLGHWGEMLPFFLERIDRMTPIANLPRSVSEYVAGHAWLTPGGVFSQRYLRWALEVVGIDRIMFAADYPYAPTDGGAARRFVEEADLSDADREKVAWGNWDRLTADIRR